MTNFITRLWGAWQQRGRAERVLRKCGNYCLCPACKDILNDQAKCEAEGEAVYRYTCKCGEVSRFYFGAPVPLLLARKRS